MMMENDNHAMVVATKQLIVYSAMLSLMIAVFFVSAGHIGVRPWILFGATFANFLVSIVVQYKLNPELLAVRLKIKRKGSKLWDEILMRISNLTVLILIPAVAGLDVGRFYWSTLDIWSAVVGLGSLAISNVLLS